MEKYGGAGQVTDDNKIWCRKDAVRMQNTYGRDTHTHVLYVILVFHGNSI